jgi:CRISPR-associated protein (TIGR02584 family)
MRDSAKRNILLCVAGGTPAIITETLWALKERDEQVDEIRVITTLEGREKILTGQRNGRGAADESLLDKEAGQFYKFLREFPEAGNIKFDENCLYLLTAHRTGVPNPRDADDERLKDILTDQDNEKAANQICAIVQELADDQNVRLHASIAGGRKTMSLYLMAAMQLYGRKDDVMSHVLVSKEVEFGAPKFFYKTLQPEPILDPSGKPKTKADGSVLTTDDIEIYLANIPFIRLHGVGSAMLSQTVEGYDRIVQIAQENLERFNLKFDLKTSQVKVGERDVDLGSGGDFFVYVMFAYLRKQGRGQDGCLRVDEISLKDFDAVCRMISRARGSECGYQDFIILREESLQNLNYYFFMERNPDKSADDALRAVKKTISDSVSAIRGAFRKAEVSQDFTVNNPNKGKKKLEPVYGLKKIEPHRIKFE